MQGRACAQENTLRSVRYGIHTYSCRASRKAWATSNSKIEPVLADTAGRVGSKGMGMCSRVRHFDTKFETYTWTRVSPLFRRFRFQWWQIFWDQNTFRGGESSPGMEALCMI